MTVETYDTEVREIGHFTDGNGKKHIIINQTHWYSADKHTDETAAAAFMSRNESKPVGMTEAQERKADFVKKELTALLSAIDEDCLGAAYWVREDNEEIVTLLFENGAKKRVNVTADSLAALTRDVLKGL